MEKEEQRLITKTQIHQIVYLAGALGFLIGISVILLIDKYGW